MTLRVKLTNCPNVLKINFSTCSVNPGLFMTTCPKNTKNSKLIWSSFCCSVCANKAMILGYKADLITLVLSELKRNSNAVTICNFFYSCIL